MAVLKTTTRHRSEALFPASRSKRGAAAMTAAAMALFGAVAISTPALAAPNDPITIPDPALRACLNGVIDSGRDANADITEAEAANILEVNCQSQGIVNLEGIEYLTTITRLNVRNSNISDIAPLASLTSLENLTLGENDVSDVTPLQNLVELTYLDAGDNSISDIGPLAGLTNLSQIILTKNRIVDLTPLAAVGGSLSASEQRFDLGDVTLGQPVANPVVRKSGDPVPLSGPYDAATNTLTPAALGAGSVQWGTDAYTGTLTFNAIDPEIAITDDALRACINAELGQGPDAPITMSLAATLTDLDCPAAGIASLAGLEHLSSLEWLDLSENEFSDLGPLSNLSSLKGVLLYDNEISDVSPLASLTNLQELSLDRNDITDISALAALTNLAGLYLDGNSIADTTAISSMTELRELFLDGTGVTDFADFAPLAKLEVLGLGGNGISDVASLATLTSLRSLHLTDNDIADVAPLGALTGLERLHLTANDITDVSALSSLSELWWLSLDNNQISDVAPLSGLTKLTRLRLDDNAVTDLHPLSGLPLDDIFTADGQVVELGNVIAGQPFANPLINLDGSPVPVSDLYDAGADTITPQTLGAGSATWDNGESFSGTLMFAVVEVPAPPDLGDDDDDDDSDDVNDSGDDDSGDDPAGGVGEDGSGNQEGTGQTVSTLPETGLASSLRPIGIAGIVLFGSGVLLLSALNVSRRFSTGWGSR